MSAVERGVTFFDTAEVYGPFTNEELVGEALAPFRDKVVIATKFGFNLDPDGRRTGAASNSRPEHIRQVAEGSLKRLQDRRDRPLLSAPRRPGRADRGCRRRGEGPDRAGQGQAFRPVRSGRRRRSAAPTRSSRSRRCRANIRSGGGSPKRRCCRLCEELGIGFVPFSPLGRGFLTGKIDETTTFDSNDFRNTLAALHARSPQGEPALVDLLGEIARAEESDARADRARLAARAKAVDRPDPRHHQAAPARREHRCGCDRDSARTISADRGCRREDHRKRRPIPPG